jgi:hypothetical protein
MPIVGVNAADPRNDEGGTVSGAASGNIVNGA